ncbi:MAG: DNA methyltransferase [Candidatus Caldarchaeales archaeon]
MKRIRYIQSYRICDSWKYAENGWGISLHRICSRTGSFPPALAYYFIIKYSRPGDIVLDPFSGKGTAPLEACLNDRVGLGNDLAPEAHVLTRAKVRPVRIRRVLEWIEWAKSRINPIEYDVDKVDENVRVFYSDYTLRQILAVRDLLDRLEEEDKDLSYFLKALTLGILHGPSKIHLSIKSSHSFSMSPNYVKQYIKKNGIRKPNRDVLKCLKIKAERVLRDGIPAVNGKAFMVDARNIPIDDESVDLVITSPPYFNMQTYAWDNWLRLWFLGYRYEEVREKLFQTNSLKKFKIFIRECLREIFRVLRWDKAAIIVLGTVKLGERIVNMAEEVGPIAEEIGFDIKFVISDGVPKSNKYLWYLDEEQGVSREVILVLSKGDFTPYNVRIDWSIAKPTSLIRDIEEVIAS